MSDTSKQRPATETPLRGDAAWKAAKAAIAGRNDQASKLARQRRQKQYEEVAAQRRAAELRERAELAKRRP